MTIDRVLVAVDDSPAALVAARIAIDLARDWHATVRAVSVVRTDHLVEAADARQLALTDAVARLARDARAVLRWVEALGAEHDVVVETSRREAEDPFRVILDEAQTWDADLIVMGRSDRRGPTSPYIGSETAHVLEFADRPVLVVPRRRRGDGAAPA